MYESRGVPLTVDKGEATERELEGASATHADDLVCRHDGCLTPISETNHGFYCRAHKDEHGETVDTITRAEAAGKRKTRHRYEKSKRL